MKYALRFELINQQRTVELELDKDPTMSIVNALAHQQPVVLDTSKGVKVIPYNVLKEMWCTIVPFKGDVV